LVNQVVVAGSDLSTSRPVSVARGRLPPVKVVRPGADDAQVCRELGGYVAVATVPSGFARNNVGTAPEAGSAGLPEHLLREASGPCPLC